jgi:hypothetical protein
MRLMILRDRTLDQVEACRSSARTSPRAINVVPAESVTTAPIWIPPEFEGTEYVNVGRFAAKAHGFRICGHPGVARQRMAERGASTVDDSSSR